MKNLLFTISLLSILSSTLYSNATLTIGERSATDIDFMEANEIRDTLTIPQDTTPFSKQLTPMSAEEQIFNDARYNEIYFRPWTDWSMQTSRKQATWQFTYAKQTMYFKDRTRVPRDWFRQLINNSNFNAYESLNLPAITLKLTNLRLFPTMRGIYYDPNRAGEGFPFDYSQNSSIHINTPLFISHYSLDKKWVYGKTSFASGWIKVSDMAFVNTEFQTEFQNNKYAVTVKDNLNLIRENGESSLVKMGSIFPVDPANKKYIIATKNAKGYADIQHVDVDDIDIIAYKPIQFNAHNVAYISKQLVGEPYGWGGKEKCRDCSALTRDFFAPFGIYLSRNSRQQAKDGNQFVSIRGLSARTKKQTILNNAHACRSLLFVPGHIMLYLGEKNGEPIILHNYWGVRLKDGSKKVMGRGIITTTKPGAELPNIKKKSMLINTLTGIVNF